MNETALEAKLGHYNFSSESKKICPENAVISEVQGKNDTGIVGLLSSSQETHMVLGQLGMMDLNVKP